MSILSAITPNVPNIAKPIIFFGFIGLIGWLGLKYIPLLVGDK